MPQTPTYPTGETIDPIEHHDTHEGLATGDLDSPSNKMSTFRSETFNDYIASGGLWSADDLAVDLLASMTSVVAYIGGVRVLANAVSARAFTASKDTYIDLGDDGVIDYNEVANDATPPTLATNHIRLGVVVTDGTTTTTLFDRRNLSPRTIGRCKLTEGTADTLLIDSIPSFAFLELRTFIFATGAISTNLQLNEDTGNNYNYRRSVNGAADTTSINQTSFGLRGITDQNEIDLFKIVNIATEEKISIGNAEVSGAAGPGNAATRVEYVHKWANTTDQINRIDYNNTGAGSLDTGSILLLKGYN